MTEGEIAAQIEAVKHRAARFRAWLAEGGGVRRSFDAVYDCCGYLYLYLDCDFFDPCPICLAPAPPLDVTGDETEVVEGEPGCPAISLVAARRNYVRHAQIYPPGDPRHPPEHALQGRPFALDFDAALQFLDPTEMERRIVAIGDSYLEQANEHVYLEQANEHVIAPLSSFRRRGAG